MSTDSKTRSMRVRSRLYRPVALALGVVGIGLMGAPCAFPMPVIDFSNRYYCVPVSGTLPLEVYGQPVGGTFTWTGLVEPNTGPLVTFHAPNTPGQYEVSVTYHYEHPDPRIIYEDYTISGPINVLAMAEIIGRDAYNTYPDGPGAWVVPRGCTTDCTILEAVVTPNVGGKGDILLFRKNRMSPYLPSDP